MLDSAQRKPQPKSILLIGPPGGGKSTFMLQFPRLWVGDCDQNLDGPDRYITGLRKGISFKYDNISIDDNGNEVPVHRRWDRFIQKASEALASPDISTVAGDSLTWLGEYLISKILANANRTETQISDWNPFRRAMIAFLFAVRSKGKTSIITCHEEYKENMQGHVIKRTPAIHTKIRDYFGAFFTDIIRCESMIIGGKPQFRLQLLGDTLNDLKNTVGAPVYIDQDEDGLLFPRFNQYAKLV